MVGSKEVQLACDFDHDVTYGPMAKIKTVLMRIDIGTSKWSEFKQMNFSDTFQHGGLTWGSFWSNYMILKTNTS